MYAVAGVTGHTGQATADALISRGERVRVIVRHGEKGAPWAARGAEVAIASLDDAGALTRALNGTQGAFLLLPPLYTASDVLAAQRVLAESMARAVQGSHVGHVVFLSSIGAHLPGGLGPISSLHDAEHRLRNAGTPLTLLRASYFLENWTAVLGAVREQSVLPSFLPLDQAIEMNAVQDIGETAAALLTGPVPSGTRIVEFGGPEPVSARGVAGQLSAVLGRAVTPVQAPIDQVVPAFTGAGLSRNAAELFREMYEGVAGGRLVYEDPAAPHVRGGRRPADVLGPLLV